VNALKLTTYFGERDRARGRFLADALADLYAAHGIRASVVLRGVEGFGVKHHLRTDRQLTLSEDLPLVSIAVDRTERVEGVLGEVVELFGDGLITLERAVMPDGGGTPPPGGGNATKLTVYVGRGAHARVIEALHRHGVAGATALLGVDGTAGGARRRARFFAANADVPQMVIAVGDAEPIAAALAEIDEPLRTLERVRICKRDGELLAEPEPVAGSDPSGLGVWQKLWSTAASSRAMGTARSPASSCAGCGPPAPRARHRCAASGATTATTPPHGDSLWQLRRRVPVVTVIVDTPERIRRWFAIVDELTAETGLVTSEQVPALRATGPQIARGGLRLAEPGVR